MRYEKTLQKQAAEASLLGLGIGLFQGSSNICINAAILLVLHKGGTAVLAGDLSSGNLTTFLVSTQQIQRALAQLSVLFGSAVKANAAGCVKLSRTRSLLESFRNIGVESNKARIDSESLTKCGGVAAGAFTSTHRYNPESSPRVESCYRP